MTATIDHVPDGWIILDVMRRSAHSWTWVALVVDEWPHVCAEQGRMGQAAWLPVPGKHQNRDAAWEALQDMTETRH